MIVLILVSLLAVAGFGVVLWKSRIASVAKSALDTTMAGLSAMMDSELDDDAKEIAVRRAGLSLIAASFNIFWRFALALAAAAAPIFLADAIGLADRDAVFSLMLRLDYIVIVSVVAIILAELVRRLRRPSQTGEDADQDGAGTNRYSATDRFFHALAFSSPAVLKAASGLEDKLVRAPTQDPAAPPIFITSLARGGTTALLNAMHDMPGVATHIYRDMPFLTAPHLWGRLSGGDNRAVTRHKRAHGDGLEIDLNTPEAFEEVIWKMYWPEKFQSSGIGLWDGTDRKPEAERFLTRHMGKVIRARLGGPETPGRYCSKNNANIARLPYLSQAFPGCHVVVPVRRPESHAASLLRQHQNFLAQQSDDDFIRRYMRDIGHFEFGLIHKPIAFPGFDPAAYDPAGPDYWLAYWVAAFRHVLAHGETCHFVLQDDLRAAPEDTLTALCGALGQDVGALRFGDYFRPGLDASPTDIYDPQLYEEAAALYRDCARLAGSGGVRAAS